MKIYINREPVTGPWGGGNKIICNLSDRLKGLGHEVVYRLFDEDIDVIYCQDPRPNQHGEWYQHFLNHRTLFKSKIIQRIGDVGTHGKPELFDLVKKTSNISNFLIFPSEWSKQKIEFSKDNCEIIHNAPLKEFYKYRNNDSQSYNIITHHWSTNPKKGFHFYKLLDQYVGANNKYSFTYIGRLPNNIGFTNTRYIEATGDNDKIAKILSENSVYFSASEEEAGANHVLEGLAAGLPVVYHKNGGSVDNYCNKYGLSFDNPADMIASIEAMCENYDFYKNKVLQYDDTIDKVVDKYADIICNIK